MSWRVCCVLLVLVNLNEGQLWSWTYRDIRDKAYQGTERCMTIDGTGVVGLRPDTAREDCTKFNFCRVTGPPNELNGFPVQAVAFNCPNKDAPYYNAKTCECEAGSDHCDENYRYINSCVRPYVSGEPEETCQSFRNSDIFYRDLIPRFNKPNEFWSCAHSDQPDYRTVAHRFNCSSDLIFDLRSCDCRYTKDQVEPGFNNNPMHRYKCAEIVDG